MQDARPWRVPTDREELGEPSAHQAPAIAAARFGSCPAGVDEVAFAKAFPYYHLVPKELGPNLRFRRAILEMARVDEKVQDALWLMCRADPLFWINTFIWTYDPRLVPPMPTTVPMVTYPVQDAALLNLFTVLGSQDLCFEKSRAQGASFICLEAFLHEFIFEPQQSFLLVSRVESLVDAPRDKDALMPKLDFMLKLLPGWMVPAVERTKLHLYNEENGSAIDGASTTGNVGRGGRRRAILLDEFAAFEMEDGYRALAATQATTYCRIFNSTPQGATGAFYDMVQLEGMRKIRLFWADNPTMNRGLYRGAGGRAVRLDESYEFPTDYPFILDGKLRSPWYDKECSRTPIAALIASELDIEYLGSGSQFFPAELIAKLRGQYARPAAWCGELEYDPASLEPLGLRMQDKGRLKLWCQVDVAGRPPDDREYVVGMDVATGTGASNSAISVFDRTTREKVASWVCPFVGPDELARVCIAIARWFKDRSGDPAFVIWEANGPGRQIEKRFAAEGFANIYYRRNEDDPAAKISTIPGFWSGKETKRVLLSEYARALACGEVLNPDDESLAEMGEFIFAASGSVEHAKSIAALDPSGARENHGDRVIADAVAVKVLLTRMSEVDGEEITTRYGLDTLAGRWAERKKVHHDQPPWRRHAADDYQYSPEEAAA